MQADIFRVYNTQTIQVEISRQALKRGIVMPARCQDHFHEERWLPTPVGADFIFDSAYEGVA